MTKLAAHKDAVVKKLTDGLATMAKARKVRVIRGTGRFRDAHHLEVTAADGDAPKIVRFESAIIAAGSEAATLPFVPSDPRIVDLTGALELRAVPKKMLVLGGGIIGLEMATVYSVLGARVDVVEMLDGLMPGADRDLVAVWQKMNASRFDRIMLKTKAVAIDAKPDGIHVEFAGEAAPEQPQRYDLVLVAVGRQPNGKRIGAEKAGVDISDKGFIAVDRQMRTNVHHIYAIGDIVGEPMLAHKAVHQGHVAAENAAGRKSFFDARQIPSVAYTDPEIAWTGLTEQDAKARNVAFKKAVFPWVASGRALANGSRGRIDQTSLRSRNAPAAGRSHRRDACGRSDRRNLSWGWNLEQTPPTSAGRSFLIRRYRKRSACPLKPLRGYARICCQLRDNLPEWCRIVALGWESAPLLQIQPILWAKPL